MSNEKESRPNGNHRGEKTLKGYVGSTPMTRKCLDRSKLPAEVSNMTVHKDREINLLRIIEKYQQKAEELNNISVEEYGKFDFEEMVQHDKEIEMYLKFVDDIKEVLEKDE